MKKLVFLLLALVLLVSLVGCGLFSDNSVVKLGESYTHTDPKGLKYDERIVLKQTDVAGDLEEYANAALYPDTIVYDDAGEIVGMYDYDEETGLAGGWTDFSTGEYIAFEEGQEVDLGKVDPSQLLTVPGEVTAYFVVYGNEGEAECAYLYLLLTDASAAEIVKPYAEELYGTALTAESDTVLKGVQDKAYIDAQFADAESYGETFESKNGAAYAELLKQYYRVREDGGVSPYKPYADHADPEGLDFDERVVLAGSGKASVEEKFEKDVSAQTDYVYGKGGEAVACYSYIECPSKEAADELIDNDCFPTAERVSDTVLRIVSEGDEFQALLSTYIGYNVLKDRSVSEYVRMIEETFFSVVCD